jgi:D-beta-D-heptose 7-phosphate kinase/D-beta-D-heptose 1-phosphate adenosyltransferase
MATLPQTQLKALLIGESCIDEYKMGTVTRISPEAPVPVMVHSHTIRKDGMAINVKNNLEALGCKIKFLTNDKNSIIKRRFVDEKSQQQLLRQDIGDKVFPLESSIITALKEPYDLVVISDYCKGFITPKLAELICNRYPGLVFVDSKKENLSCFPHAYIKVNEYEDNLCYNKPSTSTKIVTLGSKGSVCRGVFYRAKNVQVHDVTGAGDVFLAALAVLTTKFDIHKGVEAATALASKSVQHFGTYTITEEDLRDIGY